MEVEQLNGIGMYEILIPKARPWIAWRNEGSTPNNVGGYFFGTREVVYILGTIEEVEEIRDKGARKQNPGAMSYPQIFLIPELCYWGKFSEISMNT